MLQSYYFTRGLSTPTGISKEDLQKFKASTADPFSSEEKIKEIVAPSSFASAEIDAWIDSEIELAKKRLDEPAVTAWKQRKIERAFAGKDEAVNAKFLSEFLAFLMGRVDPTSCEYATIKESTLPYDSWQEFREDPEGDKWKNKGWEIEKQPPYARNDKHGEEIRAYIESFLIKHQNVVKKAIELKFMGPKTLHEHYLFFKYIVKGSISDFATKFIPEVLSSEDKGFDNGLRTGYNYMSDAYDNDDDEPTSGFARYINECLRDIPLGISRLEYLNSKWSSEMKHSRSRGTYRATLNKYLDIELTDEEKRQYAESLKKANKKPDKPVEDEVDEERVVEIVSESVSSDENNIENKTLPTMKRPSLDPREPIVISPSTVNAFKDTDTPGLATLGKIISEANNKTNKYEVVPVSPEKRIETTYSGDVDVDEFLKDLNEAYAEKPTVAERDPVDRDTYLKTRESMEEKALTDPELKKIESDMQKILEVIGLQLGNTDKDPLEAKPLFKQIRALAESLVKHKYNNDTRFYNDNDIYETLSPYVMNVVSSMYKNIRTRYPRIGIDPGNYTRGFDAEGTTYLNKYLHDVGWDPVLVKYDVEHEYPRASDLALADIEKTVPAVFQTAEEVFLKTTTHLTSNIAEPVKDLISMNNAFFQHDIYQKVAKNMELQHQVNLYTHYFAAMAAYELNQAKMKNVLEGVTDVHKKKNLLVTGRVVTGKKSARTFLNISLNVLPNSINLAKGESKEAYRNLEKGLSLMDEMSDEEFTMLGKMNSLDILKHLTLLGKIENTPTPTAPTPPPLPVMAGAPSYVPNTADDKRPASPNIPEPMGAMQHLYTNKAVTEQVVNNAKEAHNLIAAPGTQIVSRSAALTSATRHLVFNSALNLPNLPAPIIGLAWGIGASAYQFTGQLIDYLGITKSSNKSIADISREIQTIGKTVLKWTPETYGYRAGRAYFNDLMGHIMRSQITDSERKDLKETHEEMSKILEEYEHTFISQGMTGETFNELRGSIMNMTASWWHISMMNAFVKEVLIPAQDSRHTTATAYERENMFWNIVGLEHLKAPVLSAIATSNIDHMERKLTEADMRRVLNNVKENRIYILHYLKNIDGASQHYEAFKQLTCPEEDMKEERYNNTAELSTALDNIIKATVSIYGGGLNTMGSEVQVDQRTFEARMGEESIGFTNAEYAKIVQMARRDYRGDYNISRGDRNYPIKFVGGNTRRTWSDLNPLTIAKNAGVKFKDYVFSSNDPTKVVAAVTEAFEKLTSTQDYNGLISKTRKEFIKGAWTEVALVARRDLSTRDTGYITYKLGRSLMHGFLSMGVNAANIYTGLNMSPTRISEFTHSLELVKNQFEFAKTYAKLTNNNLLLTLGQDLFSAMAPLGVVDCIMRPVSGYLTTTHNGGSAPSDDAGHAIKSIIETQAAQGPLMLTDRRAIQGPEYVPRASASLVPPITVNPKISTKPHIEVKPEIQVKPEITANPTNLNYSPNNNNQKFENKPEFHITINADGKKSSVEVSKDKKASKKETARPTPSTNSLDNVTNQPVGSASTLPTGPVTPFKNETIAETIDDDITVIDPHKGKPQELALSASAIRSVLDADIIHLNSVKESNLRMHQMGSEKSVAISTYMNTTLNQAEFERLSDNFVTSLNGFIESALRAESEMLTRGKGDRRLARLNDDDEALAHLQVGPDDEEMRKTISKSLQDAMATLSCRVAMFHGSTLKTPSTEYEKTPLSDEMLNLTVHQLVSKPLFWIAKDGNRDGEIISNFYDFTPETVSRVIVSHLTANLEKDGRNATADFIRNHFTVMNNGQPAEEIAEFATAKLGHVFEGLEDFGTDYFLNLVNAFNSGSRSASGSSIRRYRNIQLLCKMKEAGCTDDHLRCAIACIGPDSALPFFVTQHLKSLKYLSPDKIDHLFHGMPQRAVDFPSLFSRQNDRLVLTQAVNRTNHPLFLSRVLTPSREELASDQQYCDNVLTERLKKLSIEKDQMRQVVFEGKDPAMKLTTDLGMFDYYRDNYKSEMFSYIKEYETAKRTEGAHFEKAQEFMGKIVLRQMTGVAVNSFEPEGGWFTCSYKNSPMNITERNLLYSLIKDVQKGKVGSAWSTHSAFQNKEFANKLGLMPLANWRFLGMIDKNMQLLTVVNAISNESIKTAYQVGKSMDGLYKMPDYSKRIPIPQELAESATLDDLHNAFVEKYYGTNIEEMNGPAWSLYLAKLSEQEIIPKTIQSTDVLTFMSLGWKSLYPSELEFFHVHGSNPNKWPANWSHILMKERANDLLGPESYREFLSPQKKKIVNRRDSFFYKSNAFMKRYGGALLGAAGTVLSTGASIGTGSAIMALGAIGAAIYPESVPGMMNLARNLTTGPPSTSILQRGITKGARAAAGAAVLKQSGAIGPTETAALAGVDAAVRQVEQSLQDAINPNRSIQTDVSFYDYTDGDLLEQIQQKVGIGKDPQTELELTDHDMELLRSNLVDPYLFDGKLAKLGFKTSQFTTSHGTKYRSGLNSLFTYS